MAGEVRDWQVIVQIAGDDLVLEKFKNISTSGQGLSWRLEQKIKTENVSL